ncbi:MAG: 50S rRNA methyltransferase [Deltaproteobacteria bacterium]|nr:50S rRNA methyltransferase [Deltaproteobacteria bacterium]
MFVRHVMPVDVEVELTGLEGEAGAAGEAGDAARLVAATRPLAARVDPSRTLSIQARLFAEVAYRPFVINEALAASFAAPIDVRRPAWIVSVVVARRPSDGALRAWVGLSTAADNLSDWAGGARRIAADPAEVSRAEKKLVEALEVFGLEAPRGGTAIDLGAAPGGWTRVLRARGLSVHAVDPGALDPRVGALPGVVWHPTTAERFLVHAEPVDVLVADMKMDARDAARLVGRYAPKVRRFAVLTLKLPERGARAVAQAGLALLERDWRVLGARQLFHNRSEVTVALAPRGV